MIRKLASIQKISDIQPIPNADAIEVATILGWKVVVKKNEFKVGDICIYCEIDSVMPSDKPAFEFLRNKKFRIKTCKLRGQISQGIAFPLEILSEGAYAAVEEGDDVTEELGVKKYEIEIPAQLRGEIQGSFPGYCSKTDEMRIQTVPEIVNEFKGKLCYVSVKVDGTSATYIKYGDEYHVCSRNLSFKFTEKNESSAYFKIWHKYNIKNILGDKGDMAIQGEICGPGIQKNPMKLPELDFFVFNVYDVKQGKYLDYNDFEMFCNANGFKTVPIIGKYEFNFTLDKLIEMAKGKYEGTDHHREGIVIRPLINCYSEILGGRLSIKIINNDYLLSE